MQQYTAANWPGDRWPNFSFFECRCKETGECWLEPDFMDALQAMRMELGGPLNMTSVYRAPTHSAERDKPNGPGVHPKGCAGDIRCSGEEANRILGLSYKHGIRGRGVEQGNNKPHSERFLHLDMYVGDGTRPRPTLWTY